jgi:hypothetical protein
MKYKSDMKRGGTKMKMIFELMFSIFLAYHFRRSDITLFKTSK